MTNTLSWAAFVILGFSSFVWAADQKVSDATFPALKSSRGDYAEKTIQIEGRIKNLKLIKEGGNKVATFFLTDPNDAETTVSVRVNLTKKKTIVNTFSCIDGEFTTVQGRFKPWGQASYLGKIEVRETYHFNCSESSQGLKHDKDLEAKKKAESGKTDEIKFSKPFLLKMGSGGTSKVVDANGKRVDQLGAALEPGSLIETGPHSAVQLKYPDGSKISIGSNSQIVTEKGSDHVQEVSFNFGRIHALISKQKSNDVHFKVKTRAATMGVRGTQFYIEQTPTGKAVTRVIEGTVDVAKDDQSLLAGKGQRVSQDELVEVEDGKIQSPKHFDANAYVAKIKAEQAELVSFADSPEDSSSIKDPSAVKAGALAEAPSPSPTLPQATTATTSESKSQTFAQFRLAALGYLSKDSSSAFTGMVSWNPEIHLAGNWNLGLDLGFAPRNTTLEYSLFGSFAFSPSISAEIKAGAQSFLSEPKVSGGMGGLALRYKLGCSCFLDSIIVGDDILSLKGTTFNIVRAALGIRF